MIGVYSERLHEVIDGLAYLSLLSQDQTGVDMEICIAGINSQGLV